MFYQFMKWYLGWMMKLHYRYAFSRGVDKIPNGQPVIFASNHPAGFSEPIIFATNVKQTIHFLVLGSFLTAKWLKWFFNGVKMVPIYRRDIAGDKSIEKNVSTFQYVYDALKQNSHILIYPEAKTHFTYKVRPLRKGIARMARGFLQSGTHKHMFIVPVGANFIYPDVFRSDMFIDIGDPIKIELDDDLNDERKWLKKVVDLTSKGMKKVVFDVEDEERHSIIQDLLELKKENLITKYFFTGKPYRKNVTLIAQINAYVNYLANMESDKFEELKRQLEKFKLGLKANKLSFRSFQSIKNKIGIRAFILLLGFPLFFVSIIMHGFSLIVSKYVKTNLVKRIEYKAAVASAIPTILTLLGSIALLIFGILFHPLFFILAFIFPLSLYFLIHYYDFAKSFFGELKMRSLNEKEKDNLSVQLESILSFGN